MERPISRDCPSSLLAMDESCRPYAVWKSCQTGQMVGPIPAVLILDWIYRFFSLSKLLLLLFLFAMISFLSFVVCKPIGSFMVLSKLLHMLFLKSLLLFPK